MTEQKRSALLGFLSAALHSVNGRLRVREVLANSHRGQVVWVVAIGKAAEDMALGARDALRDDIAGALVITPPGYAGSGQGFDKRFRVLQGSHPVPDESSLLAGRELLQFIAVVPGDETVLFLISGGASSLVEVLPDGIGLADLRAVNTWLLGSGLDIHQVNRVRKAISCIKGGRLALQLGRRRARVLMMSDVPGDEPASIGSGLLFADLARLQLPGLPEWLGRLCGKAQPAPTQGSPELQRITGTIIACNEDACRAGENEALASGFRVHRHAEPLTGSAEETGRTLAQFLLDAAPGLHVWGGETTVRLPQRPGRGGRNQHLALSAALILQGMQNVALLAAGTDGSDGNGEDAGALVDGSTVARGSDAGLDARRCLERADSGSFLVASGDLVNTGPTGTNVMDLVFGLRW